MELFQNRLILHTSKHHYAAVNVIRNAIAMNKRQPWNRNSFFEHKCRHYFNEIEYILHVHFFSSSQLLSFIPIPIPISISISSLLLATNENPVVLSTKPKAKKETWSQIILIFLSTALHDERML